MLPILSLRFFMMRMPGVHCPTFTFFGLGFYFCSAWNLLGVAMIRCVVVFRNRISSTKIFHWSSRILPVITWIIPFMTLLPSLLGKYGRFLLSCKDQYCRLLSVDENGDPLQLSANLSLILIFIGAILIILNAATYVRVAWQPRKLSHQMKDASSEIATEILEKEKKVGLMMGVVTIFFFITFMMDAIVRTIDFNFYLANPNLQTVLLLITYSIVIVDPLIYIILQEQYRMEITNLLKAIPVLFMNFIK